MNSFIWLASKDGFAVLTVCVGFLSYLTGNQSQARFFYILAGLFVIIRLLTDIKIDLKRLNERVDRM